MKRGSVQSEEAKEKIRVAKLGKKLTEEHRSAISNSLKGRQPENSKKWIGKGNYMWKGEKASYPAKHMWLYKWFGKANKCENTECVYPRTNANGKTMEKANSYQWANISKEYKRDRKDYIQLCTSCHKKWDLNLIEIT